MTRNNDKSMIKAIQHGYVFIILMCIAVWALFFSYFMSNYMLKQTEASMEYSLTLTDKILDYNEDIQKQIDELNNVILDKSSRITVVDLDGNVVADTNANVDYNDNHYEREEIRETMNGEEALTIRYSKTMKREMIYVAGLTSNGEYILRLALPYNGKIAFLKSFLPAIFAGVILSVAIALLIARKTAKSITEPLSDISDEMAKIQAGGEEITLKKYKYSEINRIADTVMTMSDRIEKNIDRLKREKNKINYILDNMKEGLIILDNKKDVIIINKAAIKFLGANENVRGKNVVHYTQNMNIIDAVGTAIENDSESVFDIKGENNKTIAMHVTKVQKSIIGGDGNGAILLLVDVSAEREAQKTRQEFFSNASHELKTPITSIQGYSELLVSGLPYSEEQKNEFLNRIRSESAGMTVLINDILTISRLEAGIESENVSVIDVENVINGIINTTQPQWTENDLKINMECKAVYIKADYTKIQQLFNNLIVNAIKYNKTGGSVSVKCAWAENRLNIAVEDTGIGIPLEAQSRVFERFYRVDKGRCKRVGGTGLGLAIVKHIVNFYNGSIVLTSEIDVGTKIEISIPFERLEKSDGMV